MEKIIDTEDLYVYWDEFGRIENQDANKVYFTSTSSRIKVILPPGALELHAATMIINLPFANEDGSVIYTIVNPFKSTKGSKKSEKVEEIKDDNIMNTYYVEVEPETNKIGTQKFYVTLNYPGVFFFQFKYGDNQYTDPQWIQVDPNLLWGEQAMNVNWLRILTVLSRSLGKMERWGEFWKIQKKLGYNAIHFTPIQQ